MGIKGLAKLLSDEAPDCIREVELKSLHGRAIAIDASMAIYQFLIAVRSSGGAPNQQSFMLTNSEGETTSHIQVVLAPCEAEAQAAALAKAGKVYAAGTEDMDALTFQTPILVRKMTFASASKSMVQTMDHRKALQGLGLTQAEFVDLCILLGCDYCDTIKGVGPKTALKLIREHKNIETILKHLDRSKYSFPERWLPPSDAGGGGGGEQSSQEEESPPSETKAASARKEDDEDEEEFIPVYVQARKLFNEHEVLDNVDLKWKPCQPEELTKFLVDEMGFNPDRVKSSIDKLQAAYKANKTPQLRMDNFFTVKPNPNAAKIAEKKRKAEKEAAAAKKKAATKKKR